MSKKFHESYDLEEEEEEKEKQPTTFGSLLTLLLLILAAILWFGALPEYTEFMLTETESNRSLLDVEVPGDGTIPGRADEEAVFVFFDVGAGNSILLQSPDNSTSLIDGGEGKDPRKSEIPAYNLAQNLYQPFFNITGIQRLRKMVSTTPFSHYMGAQVDLLRYSDLEINEILLPPYEGHFPPFRFLEAEAEGGIDIGSLESEQELIFGPGLKGKVLQTNAHPENRAEASSVLYLKYGNIRILITSHLPREGEKELVLNWGRSLDVDLLVVGRHGGDCATGDELLEHADPTFAVITRDEENLLTEGTKTVIDRLQEAEVESRNIYRTDRDSHVALYTDGNRVRFQRNAFPFLSH